MFQLWIPNKFRLRFTIWVSVKLWVLSQVGHISMEWWHYSAFSVALTLTLTGHWSLSIAWEFCFPPHPCYAWSEQNIKLDNWGIRHNKLPLVNLSMFMFILTRCDKMLNIMIPLPARHETNKYNHKLINLYQWQCQNEEVVEECWMRNKTTLPGTFIGTDWIWMADC